MDRQYILHSVLVIMTMSGMISRSVSSVPPTLDNITDTYLIVSEATQPGTVVGHIYASDADGDGVTIRLPDFETDSRTLVILNQTSIGPPQAVAHIILDADLDRDFSPSVRDLYFLLEDDSGDKVQTIVVFQLLITDVNDEPPVFINLPYRFDLSEDHPAGGVVYSNISAVDPDSGPGGAITYSIQPITQSSADATDFMATFSIDPDTGQIRQLSRLDYEKILFYQFTVVAKDGLGLESSEVLTIRVLDVQDTRPYFLATPYMVTIAENTPNDTHIFTARALDGDRGIPNDVIFSFESGSCLHLFAINETTGEITVADLIDRDAGVIMQNGGLCLIVIKVTEKINGQENAEDVAMATTSLSIYVSDENDNAPSFNEMEYDAYISDTAQLNYPLQLDNKTEIVIEDLDQGSSGILELLLRNQDGDISYDFQPIPSVIASVGRPIIALKSPGLLFLRDTITLTIIATERDTTEKLSATSVINIRVLRVQTTKETTTILTSTTLSPDDPFIPSLIGAVIPCLLLAWALMATCYYFWRKSSTSNKVSHHDFQNGNSHQHPVSVRPAEQATQKQDSNQRNQSLA